MKVIMISQDYSLDAREMDNESNRFRKLLASLCQHLDELHVIHRSYRKEVKSWQDNNLFVYPIPMVNKFLRPWIIIKTGILILRRHEIGLITAGDVLGIGLAAYILKKIYKKPIVLELHGDYLDNNYYINKGIEYKAANIFGKWLLHKGDLIRATSHKIRNYLLSFGIPEEKIFLLPHRTDIHIFRPGIETDSLLKSLGINQEKILLFIGRFVPVKNLRMMINAFSLIVRSIPSKLILIGGGIEKESLQKYVNESGLSSYVLFLDSILYNQVPPYYNLADVFLLSSISEGRPNVIQEAMACGVPVIATRLSGTEELVEDGKTGFLVEVGDEKGMATAIKKILEDRDLRQKMSEQCRIKMENDWTWERGICEYIRMIRLGSGKG
ncbi:MAG: glycosyltransferase family 4 protein [Nitrospirota bacterium]